MGEGKGSGKLQRNSWGLSTVFGALRAPVEMTEFRRLFFFGVGFEGFLLPQSALRSSRWDFG